jgi:endonuclease/exonuclease/phosphatase family metal-dependent hydrolase
MGNKISSNKDESLANAFGYTNDGISKIEIDSSIERFHDKSSEHNEFIQSSNLTVLTFNVWQNDKMPYSRYLERMEHAIKLLIEKDADIVFLQEVGLHFLKALKNSEEISSMYNFSVNVNDCFKKNNVITLILSKQPIIRSTFSVLSGDHFHNFTAVETENLCLVNCHLHAGSKFSPGCTNYQKYSDYRKKQLGLIKNFIDEYNIFNKKVILGGDFNLDLNNKNNDFPEISAIHDFDLIDSWKSINPDQQGLTEDTDENKMRWNTKQQKKEFRYDGIFVNKKIQIESAELIGTEAVFLTNFKDELKRDQFKNHVEKANLDVNKMKLFNDNTMEWFISDHFGIFIKLVNK